MSPRAKPGERRAKRNPLISPPEKREASVSVQYDKVRKVGG
jgi:hypothetical protein